MKTFDEIISEAVYGRLDEIPEYNGFEEELSELLKTAEENVRTGVYKLLEEESLKRSERDKEVYLRGLKDGFKLAEFISEE